MFEKHSPGVVLVQNKEPAFSRKILTFLNKSVTSDSSDDLISTQADLTALTLDNIIDIAKQAGIVDERDGRMLYKKLAKASPSAVIRLVMDALDDEPYVSSQMGPLIHLSKEAVGGLKLLAEVFGNKDAVIYIHKNLTALNTKIPKVLEGVPVEGVGGKYPVEHGSLLNIRPGDLIVGTCAMIHLFRAVYQGVKQSTCFVTVSGNCVANPRNLEVSLGMTVDAIIERCGLIDIPTQVIVGGPMTGTSILDTEKTLVNTTTRAIIAMKEVRKNSSAKCIGCGRCVECCPVNLHPMYIYKAAAKHKLKDLETTGYSKCVGCGTCSYVCPAKLDLSSTIHSLTERLAPSSNG